MRLRRRGGRRVHRSRVVGCRSHSHSLWEISRVYLRRVGGMKKIASIFYGPDYGMSLSFPCSLCGALVVKLTLGQADEKSSGGRTQRNKSKERKLIEERLSPLIFSTFLQVLFYSFFFGGGNLGFPNFFLLTLAFCSFPPSSTLPFPPSFPPAAAVALSLNPLCKIGELGLLPREKAAVKVGPTCWVFPDVQRTKLIY